MVKNTLRGLESYTDDELIEELARRRNVRRADTPERWCHNCENYKTWLGDGDPPDTYNPCGNGHKMSFWVPDEYSPDPDEYGYYRRVCADRKERPDIT